MPNPRDFLLTITVPPMTGLACAMSRAMQKLADAQVEAEQRKALTRDPDAERFSLSVDDVKRLDALYPDWRRVVLSKKVEC
jgi:hypothetical protein